MSIVEPFRQGLWPACLLLLIATSVVSGCGDDWEATPETQVKPSSVSKANSDGAAAPVDPAGTNAPRVIRLRWTGCDISKKAYINIAVAAYERSRGVQIIVTGGGATRGIRATAGGMADMGGSCRHALPGRFPDQEGDVRLTHVAWDALVFFTHPDNPIEGITSEQARGILLGQIRNWNELGGPDAKIIPAFRQQTALGKLSGVGYMTRIMLFEDPDVDYRQDAIFHTSSGPIEEFVESTKFAFAVTGVSSAKKRSVKILALDGIRPQDKENIQSGRYPLTRPLYLVTKGEPTGALGDFIYWIVGEEGQAVLSDAGTVNLQEGSALKALFKHWPPDKRLIRND